MDKVGRVLLLFWQLYCGKRISKEAFCLEMDIDRRTFDRDIAAVRDFLAEIYSGHEIVFEPKGKFYYMTGVRKRVMTEVESTAIIHILLGSRALRKDEMSGLINSLEQVTEHMHSDGEDGLGDCGRQYRGSVHHAAVLKMQWDLLQCIRWRKVIRIRYLEADGRGGEREIIPLKLYFEEYHFRLKAIETENREAEKVFEVDRIEEFQIIRDLSRMERQAYWEGE